MEKKIKPIESKFRQIHLDFHTGEQITGIGENFDEAFFVDTLARAHVNQVCCFARDHHGMMYYRSRMNPERIHPFLAEPDLLQKQINACHRRDIRVHVYTTIQWDYFSAQQHPEWLCIDEEGKPLFGSPYKPGFYHMLCLNSPYREFIKQHVDDLFKCVRDIDGVFFDIMLAPDCSCRNCRKLMHAAEIDPTVPENRLRFSYDTLCSFIRDLSTHVRTISPDCAVYFNNGAVGPNQRKSIHGFTHLEFDSHPSGESGYGELSRQARFERNLGLDCVAMTGKFHTTWGDFHSFKNLAALQYECFKALSLNCKCSIGDQLPPDGRIEPEVYELIGKVYEEVEKKEPWCRRATAVTEIGILSENASIQWPPLWKTEGPLMGAVNILNEGGHQFDILDDESDFSRYSVIVLPDNSKISKKVLHKIDDFVGNGGRVLAAFEGGMDRTRDEFPIADFPVRFAGQGPIYSDGKPARGRDLKFEYADFIRPEGAIGNGLPSVDHVMYMRGVEVSATKGSEILSYVTEPVFFRTYRHFCSHRHSPSSKHTSYPAIVRNDSVVYFGHPVFSLYYLYAPLWVKTMVLNGLAQILPKPLVKHSGPSTIEVTVNEQPEDNRWVVHLLHFVPQKRAKHLEIIEDVIPLYNISLAIRVASTVKSMRLVPEDKELPVKKEDERLIIVVPELVGHQMVEIKFADNRPLTK